MWNSCNCSNLLIISASSSSWSLKDVESEAQWAANSDTRLPWKSRKWLKQLEFYHLTKQQSELLLSISSTIWNIHVKMKRLCLLSSTWVTAKSFWSSLQDFLCSRKRFSPFLSFSLSSHLPACTIYTIHQVKERVVPISNAFHSSLTVVSCCHKTTLKEFVFHAPF